MVWGKRQLNPPPPPPPPLTPSVLLQETVLRGNSTKHTGTPPLLTWTVTFTCISGPCLNLYLCLWTLHFTCTSPLDPAFDLYCPAGAVWSAERGTLRRASVPGAYIHLGGTAWGDAARLAAAAARVQVR